MWEVTTDDVTEYKQLMQANGGKHDAFIQTMLPLLAEHVADYVQDATFGAEIVEPPLSALKGSYKLFIAKALQHNMTAQQGLKGRKMGSVSYTYELEFPRELYRQYLPRKKVRFYAL